MFCRRSSIRLFGFALPVRCRPALIVTKRFLGSVPCDAGQKQQSWHVSLLQQLQAVPKDGFAVDRVKDMIDSRKNVIEEELGYRLEEERLERWAEENRREEEELRELEMKESLLLKCLPEMEEKWDNELNTDFHDIRRSSDAFYEDLALRAFEAVALNRKFIYSISASDKKGFMDFWSTDFEVGMFSKYFLPKYGLRYVGHKQEVVSNSIHVHFEVALLEGELDNDQSS